MHPLPSVRAGCTCASLSLLSVMSWDIKFPFCPGLCTVSTHLPLLKTTGWGMSAPSISYHISMPCIEVLHPCYCIVVKWKELKDNASEWRFVRLFQNWSSDTIRWSPILTFGVSNLRRRHNAMVLLQMNREEIRELLKQRQGTVLLGRRSSYFMLEVGVITLLRKIICNSN